MTKTRAQRINARYEAIWRKAAELKNAKPKTFYSCGCCEQFHPWNFTGDCRDDDNRFNPEDLPDGWQEVSQDEADAFLNCNYTDAAVNYELRTRS